MAEREDVVRKVQALWAQADHPNTGPSEREAFVTKAHDLMAKYQIDEMILEESSNTSEAVVLSDIRLFKEDVQTLVPDQRMKLAHYIAINNRCKGVITDRPASVASDGSIIYAGTYICVIGFHSDVAMVKLLYNALGADMIFAMSDEPTEHMKARDREDYFVNFCDAYADRVNRRLRDIGKRVEEVASQGDGSLLPVLRSRALAVQDRMHELFPGLTVTRIQAFTHDANARARGAAAADKADIGAGSQKLGNPTRGELS